MSDASVTPLIDLADRIVSMAKQGGATVAECIVRQGAELSARAQPGLCCRFALRNTLTERAFSSVLSPV